jgi:hypothetical protein
MELVIIVILKSILSIKCLEKLLMHSYNLIYRIKITGRSIRI